MVRHIQAWAARGHGPLDAALRALDEAVAKGDQREGAWPLLAADALLTQACDEALDAADPGAALAHIFRSVAEK